MSVSFGAGPAAKEVLRSLDFSVVIAMGLILPDEASGRVI